MNNLDNYNQWLGEINQDKLEALTNRKNWYGLIAGFYAFILLSQFIKPLKNFLQLEPLAPSVTLAILALVVWILTDKSRVKRSRAKYFGALMIGTSALFQIFTWSLTIFSKDSFAPLLATLPILIAVYHAEFFVLSRQYLWGFIPILTASLTAALLAQSDLQLLTIVLGTNIALAAGWLMGTSASIQSDLVKERNDLREALDASTLMDSINETEKTKNLLYELMGANHDAGNAITSVIMNLELLTGAIEDPDENEAEIVAELSGETRESLSHLMSIIEEARSLGKEVHKGELVNASELLQSVVATLRTNYRNKKIELTIDSHYDLFLKLHGGETTLQRVLTNLIKNACEGNGSQVASTIDITASVRENNLTIAIADDGPGFETAYLNSVSSTYQTTKEHGSGLGLHTCKRLLNANKGKLELTNRAEGGALVTVRLPLSA